MRKTLFDIARKLEQTGDRWLLAGKTAAVLQGAMIQSSKLTLYSNQVTAYKFGEYFDEYRSLKVKYRSESPLSGHAGTFSIHDVEVSIVGDPEIAHHGKHHFLPVDLLLQQTAPYSMDGVQIPLLPKTWLTLLGLMGNDTIMTEALIQSGVAQQEVLKTAQELGLAFHLKPLIDSAYTV